MPRGFRYSTLRRQLFLLLLSSITFSISFAQSSIFQPTDVPATLDVNDGHPIELGVKFRATVNGSVTAIRFYKGPANTGTHIGHLWSTANTTTPLATVTFTGETASGWQEMSFAYPVGITAGQTYIASYYSNDGHYSATESFFTSAVVNGPLRALADGEDGPNGIYTSDATASPATYPSSSFLSTNYWVDIVFVNTDIAPPVVTVISPLSGATNVNTGSNVTAIFSEALDETTISSSTFELRDQWGALVPATITYNAGTETATLTPSSALLPATTYTATLQGGNTGTRIRDLAGNDLPADYIWSFTTQFPPPLSPNDGPGGPILVLSTATNPFSRFPVEILRAEGLNEFGAADISTLSASLLNGYDVVIVGEMTLNSGQAAILDAWVNAGGTLIAFRPGGNELNALLGISSTTGTLADKYLLVNTTSGPGLGIVNQTMQYHGVADLRTLTGGATSVATFYSDATTATTNPAISIRNAGNGKAIAFMFDLARSVVYTRQGNPAQAGTETDGLSPIRSDDQFFPGYVDMDKIQIPQADEQQRLLTNIIIQSNLAKKPLPRFWYLPGVNKAAVIYTIDDHGTSSGTQDIFEKLIANSPVGGTLANWQAYRATSWTYVGIPLNDSMAAVYHSQGFDIGVHVQNGCANFTSFVNLDASYTPQLQTFQNAYPSLPPQSTHRFHCIVWSDWLTQAKVELSHGIRFSMDYYYWPPEWINGRPGLFTGSALPMRFADLNGDLLDVYQGVSDIVNENGIDYSLQANTLLDNAIGSKGYYGFFGTHDDYRDTTFSTAIINSAKARNVPIISAKQALDWVDGRGNSSFGSITWSGNQLSFSVVTYEGADNLSVMLPLYSSNGQLSAITRNGMAASFTTESIKGMQYAFVDAPLGFNSFVVTYTVDVTPPVISNIVATPNADGVSATITWTTNEASDSRVDFGTVSNTLDNNVSDNNNVTSHSILLTGLVGGTTYHFRVTSKDAVNNSVTEPALNNSPLNFTMPDVCISDVTDTDFDLGTHGATTITVMEGDGAVILKPFLVQDFTGSSMPAGWSGAAFNPGSTTFSGGSVTVNGTQVYTNGAVAPETSIEFVATFNPGVYQNVGLTSDQAFNNAPWIVIGQGGSVDGSLYARASDGAIANLGSNLLGSAHHYRIKWNPANFQFFVDGVLKATINLNVTVNMYIQISDVQNTDGVLSVDWVRAIPYASSGLFTSRVFDATTPKTWGAVNWNSDVPAGTSIAIAVRTGNTPVPDGTWSAFIPINASGDPLGATSRYIQYTANLATTDINFTPVLKNISVNCSEPVEVPAVTTQPAAQTVCAGVNASFTSAATGSPAPIVQWQVSTDGTIWTNIDGATSATLTFASSLADHNKQYRAVWTNSLGSVNSNAAVLTVNAVPSAPTVTVTNNCGNSVLTASDFTGALLWSNGATTNSITVTDAATYTVTQTINGCTSANGSGVSAPKIIPAAPTVTVSNDCGFSVLTASNYTGTLLWSNGATTSSITVNDAATYSVTQTVDGCTSENGSGVSEPKTVPSAPSVAVVDNCGNSVLTASDFTGALLWSNGATTTSITVTDAATYTVTQTINGCASANGSAVSAPKPVPSAPTVTVTNNCLSSVLTASDFTGSLLWSNGSTATSITVTNAATYTVTQTAANGCISPAGSGVSAPNPIPSAPTVTVVNNCGNSVLTASNFTGSLLWSNGATTPSITVTNSATYTVTQTVNGCTSPSASGMSIPETVPPKPVITIKGANPFCQGGSVTLTSNMKVRNLWSTGATTQSIVVTTTGTFTVTYTNEDGCTATSNPVAITVNPIPAAPTVAVVDNCGNSVLTASNYTGSLLWSNGATTPSITVMSAATYTVKQTVNGCVSPAGSGISSPKAIPAPPTVSVVDNCGNSVLTAGSYAGPLLWSNGAMTPSITVTDAATYNVSQAINGCSSALASGVSAPKTIPTAPTVSVLNNCGNSVLTASDFTGNLLWSEAAQTTTSITVAAAGTYTVTQTETNGCTSAPGSGVATPKSIPSAPLVTVDNLCGTSVLTASNYGGTLLWSEEGLSTQSITVSDAGTYTVTQTMPNGCTSLPASGSALPMTVPTAPTVTVVDNCGNSVLTASNFTGTLLWSNGATTPSITVTLGGTYTVTQTAGNGCTSPAGSGVAAPKTIPSAPTITPVGPTTFCQGGNVVLLSSSPSGNNWSNGATSQSILVTNTGNFSVMFTAANGCTSPSSATVAVTVKPVSGSNTNVTICSDQLPYAWNNQSYTSGGTYNVIFTNQYGCDSTAVLVLNVKDTSVSTTNVTICSTQLPFTWNGNSYNTGGTYKVDGFINAAGCDSSAVLVLTVNPVTHGTVNVTVCPAQLPYQWNGNDYSISGDYTVTGFTNAAGCDSSATLHLVVNQNSSSDTTVSACDSFLWNGTLYTTSGDKVITIPNAGGCDSVLTLHLTIRHSSSSDTTATACDSFLWRGTTYTTSGDKLFTTTNAEGCDSLITLHLTIKLSSSSDTTATACDSFLWRGTTYTTSGDKIFTTTNAAGCDSVITLHLTINLSTTFDTTVIACDSYLWNGTTYTTSGNKIFTTINAAGCDSTATLHLTINHSSSSDTTVTACDNFTWNGTMYTTSGLKTYVTTNAAGCDSTARLHLTITHTTSSNTTVVACNSYLWNGVTYTTSGIKAYATTNAAGCDSIAILNLTINNSSASDTTAIACGSFLWHETLYTTSGDKTFTTTNAVGCDSVITLHLTINQATTSNTTVAACDSYTWNSTTYTVSGTYTYSTVNAAGCDSTATLNLTISQSPAAPTITVTEGTTTFCQGGSVILTASAADGYLWSTGATTQSITVTASGSYTVSAVGANGCTSAVSLPVVVTVNVPTSSTETITACNSYLWNNTTYTTSGTYTVNGLVNAANCDSTATLILTINQSLASDTTATACDNFLWHGTLYTTSGDKTFTTTSVAGCDSVITLHLTINQSTASDTTATACDNFLWHGTLYTTSGDKIFTTTNAAGCDSVITLHLTINQSPAVPVITPEGPTTFCQGGSVILTANAADGYLWSTGATTQSITVIASGSYTVSAAGANGCISGASLPVVVTVNVPTSSTETITACNSYLWNNTTYTTSGTYIVNGLTNVAGCDSTATLILTISQGSASDTTATACDSFLWHGTLYTTSGDKIFTTTNAAGCDSVITLHLAINQTTASDTTATACDSFLWHGTLYTTPGDKIFTTTNAAGCDSVITLHLTINQSPVAPTITVTEGTTTFCQGGSVILTASAADGYLWSTGATTQSITVTASGSYTVSAVGANGCTSVASLPVIVTVNVPTNSTETITACNNYTWNNTLYSASGTYNVNGLINAAGCDSTATLVLTINQSTASDTTATVCDSFLWHGTLYTTSGDKIFTTTNAAGCDSVITLHLTINQSPAAPTITVTEGTTTFCQGGSVILTASAADGYLWSTGATTQSITVTASGSYTVSAVGANGCTSVASLPVIVTVNVPTSSTETITACNNYTWNNTLYTASGTYIVNGLINAAGCDSTATLVLTINQSTASDTTATVCDSFLWHGTLYTTSGDKIFTTANAAGCDSVITLHLTINQSTASDTTAIVCDSFLWHGTLYTTSGNKTFTTTNAAGCDSVITLHLTILQSTTSETTITACDSYLWNGTLYTTSGDKIFTTTNAAGCDSVATLHLTINPSTASDTTATACDSFLWHGTLYTTSGDKLFTTTNTAGCDSVITLHLTINQSPAAPTITVTEGTTTFCQGGSVTLTSSAATGNIWSTGATTQSIVVTAAGSYTVSFADGNGCTSPGSSPVVVIVNVPTSSTETITACNSYIWNNTTYTTSGTYNLNGLTNVAGCDSTATLVLTINQSSSSTTTITACDSYTWNSVTYTTSGTYTVNGLTNVAGCDSTATLILTINQSPAAPTITVSEGITTFCEGGSVILTSSATEGNVWSNSATTQSITVTTAGSYTVSYTGVNGCVSPASLPVVVTVNVPTSSTTNVTICASQVPFNWNSTDYSVAGSYTIHLTNAAGCDSAATLVLAIDPVSVGGDVSPSATVCAGSNGTLTLSGHTGNVIRWEESTDGGNNWTSIANTTTSLSYTNITVETMYRAVVQSGACNTANSTTATISIASSAVGGDVASSATVCAGSNSGTLILSGHNGDVIRWEQSTDGGNNWLTITNTTTSQSYTDLTQTTMFRAVVGSVSCGTINSSAATITVDPVSVGGTISGGATLCSLTNSGSLTLSGHTGNVIRWESSTDGGTNWATIANTTTTQSYTNVVTTTQYRAVVQSGSCNTVNSTIATLTLNYVSATITVSPDSIMCAGSSITFTAVVTNGGTTPVYSWRRNGGVVGSNSAIHTANTNNYLHNDVFTVVVTSNAACVVGSPATSNAIKITKYATSDGGNLAGATTHCSTTNSGTITLSGNVGNVVRWEQGPTTSGPWTNIANTTATLSYTNLTQTTVYRALVQNGICASDYSTTETITVLPVIGGTTAGSTTVCSGANSGSITLSGHSGTISRWESSTNGGGSWGNIGNITTTLNYTNLTQTTMYRARLTNTTSCIEFSSVSTVTVTQSVGGTTAGAAIHCSTTNSGDVTLSGHTGNVIGWEQSINGGTNWTPIANTTTTLPYTNLAQTTLFRAVVQQNTCAPANSSNVTITVTPVAGGITSGSTTVCSGTNSGSITLSGHTGNVLRWLRSTNLGGTWTTITNTTTTQAYTNLTATTWYRALLQNGTCTDSSAISIVTVDPVSVGGTVSGTLTHCSVTNNGTVTLSGHTGNVVRWEQSINGGTNWTTIDNTTTSQPYTNLTQTTLYRAIVQNGVCATANSSAATISVLPVAGGTTAGSTTVCSGTNTGSVTLSGHAGNIVRWERSVNGGGSWTNVANTTATLNYTNITQTSLYRARLENTTACFEYSTISTITVDPVSVGGTVTSSATVCQGSNGATLNLTGHTGTVVRWEFSVNGAGGPWTPIANTTTSHAYSNITQTTLFRAVVQNGVCATANSSSATITVTAINGGTTAGSNSVCTGTNSGSITLSGHTGTISRWESSTDGTNWTNITNGTATQNYTNLTTTTMYRARITAGSCIAFSSVSTITVNPVSVGGAVNSSATVCSDANSGSLTLTGHTGNVVRWEQSIDGGANWTTISNTTTSQSYTNLTQTTMFRAVVQSGPCTSANSSAATITVTQIAGGTVSGSTTVCPNSNSGSLTVSGHTGTIVRWESSTNGGGSWTNISNTTATESYTNLATTTEYRVLIQNGTCSAYSSVGTITMNDVPALSSSLTGTVVSGVPINYTPTSATAGTTFAWSRATVAGIDEAGTNGSGDITEDLTNTVGVPVDVTYVFTLTSPAGCVNVQNVVITVNPPEGGRIITGIVKPGTAEAINNLATLDATAMPNPTTSYFNLLVRGKKDHNIVVRVTDVRGKPVELHQKVAPGAVLKMGEGWGAGVYVVEIIQGNERKTVKIIKTN